MIKYILQRIGAMLLTLFLVMVLSFMIIRLMPMSIFENPEVSPETLFKWQAEYILDGGRTLDKPTHFEERKGSY